MEQRRTVFINSKDRSDGNFNNFTIATGINDTFFTLRENERLFLMPSRFSVLNDFNNVSGYNNTFQIIIEDLATSNETTYTITLDVGVYTNYTLQIELEDKINAFFTAQSLPLSVSITLNDDNLKYSFAFTATTTWFDNYELRFNFTDVNTTMANLMGFADGEYIATEAISSTTATIVSYQATNMVFQPEIEVHCNLVSNNYQTESSGTIPSQVLFSVNQGAKGDFIVFENPADLYKTNSINEISTINIRYLDNLGRPILFQSDSRIALTFIKVKDIDDSERMIELLTRLEKLNELSLLVKQYGN